MPQPVHHPMILAKGLTDKSGFEIRKFLDRDHAPVLTKPKAAIIPLIITDRRLQSATLLSTRPDIRGNPFTGAAHGAADKSAGQVPELLPKSPHLFRHLPGKFHLFIIDGDKKRRLMLGHRSGKFAVHDHRYIRLQTIDTALFFLLRAEQRPEFFLGQGGKIEGQTVHQLFSLAQKLLTPDCLNGGKPKLSLKEQRRYSFVFLMVFIVLLSISEGCLDFSHRLNTIHRTCS